MQELHKSKTKLFTELVASGNIRPRPGVTKLMTEALDRGVKVRAAPRHAHAARCRHPRRGVAGGGVQHEQRGVGARRAGRCAGRARQGGARLCRRRGEKQEARAGHLLAGGEGAGLGATRVRRHRGHRDRLPGGEARAHELRGHIQRARFLCVPVAPRGPATDARLARSYTFDEDFLDAEADAVFEAIGAPGALIAGRCCRRQAHAASCVRACVFGAQARRTLCWMT